MTATLDYALLEREYEEMTNKQYYDRLTSIASDILLNPDLAITKIRLSLPQAERNAFDDTLQAVVAYKKEQNAITNQRFNQDTAE